MASTLHLCAVSNLVGNEVVWCRGLQDEVRAEVVSMSLRLDTARREMDDKIRPLLYLRLRLRTHRCIAHDDE